MFKNSPLFGPDFESACAPDLFSSLARGSGARAGRRRVSSTDVGAAATLATLDAPPPPGVSGVGRATVSAVALVPASAVLAAEARAGGSLPPSSLGYRGRGRRPPSAAVLLSYPSDPKRSTAVGRVGRWRKPGRTSGRGRCGSGQGTRRHVRVPVRSGRFQTQGNFFLAFNGES